MSQCATSRPAGGGVWYRPVPYWALLIGLVGVVWALASPALLQDPDTYLHVAAGRWILTHRALPFADPFSQSMPGARWVPHEWLAEVILAATYRVGGWGGVRLLIALSFAVSIAAFVRLLLRHLEPFSTVIVSVLAAALVMPYVLARPHMLALPLLVTWCGALFTARDSGRAPPLWLLPVMVLWANLHGGFMFGLALAGFLAAEAVLLADTRQTRWTEARRWGGFLMLATLMALVTPNGFAGLLQPFRLVLMPTLQGAIAEWRSPNLGDFPIIEAWVLGALFLGLAFGFTLPPARLLLALGLFHLTFRHVRHAQLLALVGPLAAAAALGPQIASKLRAIPRSALVRGFDRLARPAAVPAILATLALTIVIGGLTELRPINRAGDFSTPAAALAAARSMGLSGPVFNSYRFGGYLIFEGVPPVIDGRIEMYGDAFLARYLKAISGDEKALVGITAQYHIDWTLLEPHERAIAVFDRLPGWRRVYADTQAVIYRHRDGAEVAARPGG